MQIGVQPLFLKGVTDDPDWVAEFVATVEEEGGDSIWGVEHVLVAEDYKPNYPYSQDGRMPATEQTIMPDPLAWLAYAGGLSKTLTLGTSVLVLPQYSPVQLAKRLATLDNLTGGRMLLGVGLGWQEEEYAALNVPFARRGARMDEYIQAMRCLWKDVPASFEGEFVNFNRVHCDVRPRREGGVPIVIGGSSTAAARRAGRLGDGFYPYVISPDDLAARWADVEAAAKEAGRSAEAVELTLWPGSFQFGGSLDEDLMRAYLKAAPIRRITLSMHEAPNGDFAGLRELIRGTRNLLEKLGESA